MLVARVYKTKWEVDERLKTVFGVSRDELLHVVREVVGARADAAEDDPITAAGQFAYIHGTRNIRALLRSKGWLNTRRDNVESVCHPDRELRVTYQSVDVAATEGHNPQAVSGKGAGSERLIDSSCASLFSEDELRAGNPRYDGGNDSGAWYFCVSVDGDHARAELSLPSGVAGGNFKPFIERIFILEAGEWPDAGIKSDPEEGAVDFDIEISRK